MVVFAPLLCYNMFGVVLILNNRFWPFAIDVKLAFNNVLKTTNRCFRFQISLQHLFAVIAERKQGANLSDGKENILFFVKR